MQAFIVIFPKQLPVASQLRFQPVAGDQTCHRPGVQNLQPGVGRKGRRIFGDAQIEKAVPNLCRYGIKPVVGLAETFCRGAKGGADQPAVQPVGPLVIGTGDQPPAYRAVGSAKLGPAMAAGVVKGPHLILRVAKQHDSIPGGVDPAQVHRWQVAQPPGTDPVSGPNGPLLAAEPIRREISLAWQGGRAMIQQGD